MSKGQRGAVQGCLGQAWRGVRFPIWIAAIFSMAINLLMLTGPLYMLQVYDRVLGSGSVETLVALSLLAVFLYGCMGVLDHARAGLLGRAAARLCAALEGPVIDRLLARVAVDAAQGPRMIESVRRVMSSPVVPALFDLPWSPFFLLGIWIFHPLLGMLALGGALVLLAVGWAAQAVLRRHAERATESARMADALCAEAAGRADMIGALGMHAAVSGRLRLAQDRAALDQLRLGDLAAGFASLSRVLRLILQSAMLGLGAWLAIGGEVTPGAMIAGSILMGRALAPVERVIADWPALQGLRSAWRGLGRLLDHPLPVMPQTVLPRPAARLEMRGVTVAPRIGGVPALHAVDLALGPGQAVGVIGPTGAGKSALARAVTGLWPATAGQVRLGGAALAQYGGDLGRLIGYMPQEVRFLTGSVTENIARLSPAPDPRDVIAAARSAGAHDMILRLPQGYDTQLGAAGLSGGQMQRIALARALYGDPVMLVLDEPDAHLDTDGSAALSRAIRAAKAAGKGVLVMAHRPAALQECDLLLALEAGRVRAFGPRDAVLREVLRGPARADAAPRRDSAG